jgi:hypothetical protein
MYVSILVLLMTGVAAAFIAGLWGCVWIWAEIVLIAADVRRDVRAPRRGAAICDARLVRRIRQGRARSRRSLTPLGSRRSPSQAARWRSRQSGTGTRPDPLADGDGALLVAVAQTPAEISSPAPLPMGCSI